MAQSSFDTYNAFLLEGGLDRFTKLLCRYDLYRRVIDVPGDVVECGVFKGQGVLYWARLIQIFNPLSVRRVIGFDTFAGVPESVQGELDRAWSASFHGYTNVPEQVAEAASALGLLSVIELVAGDASVTMPEYVRTRPGFRIALLNLDFDVYEPTLAALDALYDRVVGGGVVLLDEYAVPTWGESNAVDEFLKGKGIALKTMPWALSPTAYFVKPLC